MGKSMKCHHCGDPIPSNDRRVVLIEGGKSRYFHECHGKECYSDWKKKNEILEPHE